ncbi:MAG: SDR family NAD(P)-dependent oxidoreductase [Deltaproteobacteria bacterium]|nr:SDR family NAD(P)-dependent oxidoreductase [Deltaproteobacteria bacterium]
MGKLQNKLALITGGGSGIGRAVAIAFAQEGADVIICGRTVPTLKETVREISQKVGRPAFWKVVDVSKEKSASELARFIEKKWGRLDILVNNAGILGFMISIEKYPFKEWKTVLQANLDSVFLVSQKMIPLLRKGKNSIIVNVTSTVGSQGRKLWGAYSVSKFGTEALTQILAQELESIRVYSINPGGARTSMRAQAYPQEDPKTLPTPEEVAKAFVYLASSECALKSGERLNARDWLGVKK